MGDGSLSSRRRVSGHSVGEGVRAMGAVQTGFYYLFSLVSVESGPRGPSLSVYILHIPVDDTAFGTPRIRSDFRSGSDALLKPSTHSPDRLLTCASSEDFSHSRSSFSLTALESSARGHSSFRFSTSRSSSKVAYAFRLLVPIVSLSPRSPPSFPPVSVPPRSPLSLRSSPRFRDPTTTSHLSVTGARPHYVS